MKLPFRISIFHLSIHSFIQLVGWTIVGPYWENLDIARLFFISDMFTLLNHFWLCDTLHSVDFQRKVGFVIRLKGLAFYVVHASQRVKNINSKNIDCEIYRSMMK